jgi:hypothetical protein
MFPCCCNNQPPPGLVQCAGQVFRISSSLPSSCPWIHQKRRASASRNDPALPSNNAHAENVYELRTENIARVRGVMALFPTATGERFASRWTWRSKSLGPTYVTRLLLGLLSRPLKIIRPRNNHIHLLRFGSPPASILAGPRLLPSTTDGASRKPYNIYDWQHRRAEVWEADEPRSHFFTVAAELLLRLLHSSVGTTAT